MTDEPTKKDKFDGVFDNIGEGCDGFLVLGVRVTIDEIQEGLEHMRNEVSVLTLQDGKLGTFYNFFVTRQWAALACAAAAYFDRQGFDVSIRVDSCAFMFYAPVTFGQLREKVQEVSEEYHKQKAI